jgi:prepilin-type N-terminal cleavage/methylation domain-containing protein
MKHNKFIKQNGFTLIEVMVGIAILGGLLVTLIYTLNYHLGLTERQFTITNITSLAREKIVEMETSPQEGEGKFPEPYEAYSYETKAKDSHISGMQEITVIVGDGKESIMLTELMRKTTR